MKKYNIEQFPKNKNIDTSKLNEYQIIIRHGAKMYDYGKAKTCNRCFKKQSIEEFYLQNKNTGRRSLSCRDCQMKRAGVLEIGKGRFSKKILAKGFRRCTICKNTKPLTEYNRSKRPESNGYLFTCKPCGYRLSRKLIVSSREEIGDFFVKQYALKKYGLRIIQACDYEKYRQEIIENRKPKYFLDGKSFTTLRGFAKYIQGKYDLPITMTEKRINEGKNEQDCKMTEKETRSKAYTKGRIKVVDTITKEVFYFKNTRDEGLREMFSVNTITASIKNGKPTRITSLSKYKNPCIIKRLNNGRR